MSQQPAIRFDEVQKSYDGKILVVKNLNLDIAEGEFLTMLGPSGSGKTTCLMMLAGFETATHGDIFLNGERINDLAPAKRGIGMVFQNYALFPHMTVEENLAYPLEVRKMDKDEISQRVDRALSMVELSGFQKRRPMQLSGGQQQRVAVARSLVFDPQVVLMDEPLGALDKQLREQMQYEIKHIHENLGITVVYVTHDQSEALTMSDRIAVFDDGVIQQLSTPSALYEQPENSFVAQFIGENNKLRGTVTSISNGVCEVDVDNCGKIVAKAVQVNAVGDRTLLSIRPERVSIEPSSADNTLSATVEERIYLGDHLRTRLSVAGRDDFIVKIPNSDETKPLKIGSTTTIGWDIEDCRALDV